MVKFYWKERIWWNSFVLPSTILSLAYTLQAHAQNSKPNFSFQSQSYQLNLDHLLRAQPKISELGLKCVCKIGCWAEKLGNTENGLGLGYIIFGSCPTAGLMEPAPLLGFFKLNWNSNSIIHYVYTCYILLTAKIQKSNMGQHIFLSVSLF